MVRWIKKNNQTNEYSIQEEFENGSTSKNDSEEVEITEEENTMNEYKQTRINDYLASSPTQSTIYLYTIMIVTILNYHIDTLICSFIHTLDVFHSLFSFYRLSRHFLAQI